jgi:hypothetical protein
MHPSVRVCGRPDAEFPALSLRRLALPALGDRLEDLPEERKTAYRGFVAPYLLEIDDS